MNFIYQGLGVWNPSEFCQFLLKSKQIWSSINFTIVPAILHTYVHQLYFQFCLGNFIFWAGGKRKFWGANKTI